MDRGQSHIGTKQELRQSRTSPRSEVNSNFCRFGQPGLPGNTSSNAFTLRVIRMNNHTLYSVNQLKPAAFAILQRLRGPAPTTISDPVVGKSARLAPRHEKSGCSRDRNDFRTAQPLAGKYFRIAA
jgi:hypothetical protein